jgi:ribonuclease P protein component
MYEFPRARRIRRRSEFVRIQNAPSARVPTRHLLLLLRPRESAGPARLGVVASKKVGPAVVRNRAKRLVREAFRKNPDAFPDGLDVVVIVRPGAHALPTGELDAQVKSAKAALHRRAAELGRSHLPHRADAPR